MTSSDSPPTAGGTPAAGVRPGFAALLRTLEGASRNRSAPELAAEAEASIQRVVRALVAESGTQDRPELAGAAARLLEAKGNEFEPALATLLALLHRYVAVVARGGHGFRVLVVEDDALAAGIVQTALAWAGHAVVIAATVADARRELLGPAFDLVVLDLLLPDGDGRNLLQAIRSEPRLSAIPVFVVSARLGQQTRQECFALGADAYFEKPLDLEAFAVATESRLVRQTHLRLQSRRDAVTGLPNRAAFLEAASGLPTTGDDESVATLAVLDLDHFRWVEETWGRQFAEGVLRRVGVRLAMSLRAASCFARWDGAEFVALFPRRSPVEAAVLVERALTGLRRLDFRAGTSPALSITFSAGLAGVRPGAAIADALASADRLCFTAKSSGRNRVVAEGSDSTVPTRRILLAEDDPRITELLVRQLRREGFEVVAYPNGAEALAAAPESGAALVITDLEMPELDGLGLLRGLREHPLTRHLPVMVLTAMGDENHIVRAFELGADDYVLKPFTIREVAARLRRMLRRPTTSGVPLTVG